jgi:hypothetical protein
LPFRGQSWLARSLVGGLLELVPALFLFPLALRAARHAWHTSPLALGVVPLMAILALLCRCVVFGYLKRLAAGTLEGSLQELPPWDRFASDLVEGFRIWLVSLGLFVPAIGLVGAGVLLVVAAAGSSLAWLPVLVLAPPLALLTLFYLPAGLLAAIERHDLGAAFDLTANWQRIGLGLGGYFLAFLVAFVAEIFAQLGLLLCCMGILLTRFMAHCVAVHAFATAYRAAAPPRLETRS